MRFAAAVAGFGQLLRGGRYTGDYDYDDVIALAQGARGEDPFGYRAEFVDLVRLARSLAVLERYPPEAATRGGDRGPRGRLRPAVSPRLRRRRDTLSISADPPRQGRGVGNDGAEEDGRTTEAG